MNRVLVVDDDRALARSLQIHLVSAGYEVRLAHTLKDAWDLFSIDPDDIVLLDLKLTDGDSRNLLTRLRETRPSCPIIMITGHQDMHATIDAIRAGAFDYIRKPLDLDQILGTVAKALESIGVESPPTVAPLLEAKEAQPREIVGASSAIVELLKKIAMLSRSRVTVLIQGETGTGKELVARALHEAAGPTGRFVAVNCGGIVPSLLESELFGHEKGSFTGAIVRKLGKLELAGEGTIFFDEVGDLPLDLQAKLLRALQESEFERVGGTTTVPLRARVMAATHRDLDSLVREGEFRQDLFFRLAVVRLDVPPLRERREDIPLLADFLLRRISEQLSQPMAGLSVNAILKLKSADWPGNVRELENVLTRATAVLRGDVIEADDLEINIPTRTTPSGDESARPRSLREAEREHILDTLNRLGWNITHAAESLEISPTTLRKKVSDFGLHRSRETGNAALPAKPGSED